MGRTKGGGNLEETIAAKRMKRAAGFGTTAGMETRGHTEELF